MSNKSNGDLKAISKRRKAKHAEYAYAFHKKMTHDKEKKCEKPDECGDIGHYVERPKNPTVKLQGVGQRPPCWNCKKQPRRHASAYCQECADARKIK